MPFGSKIIRCSSGSSYISPKVILKIILYYLLPCELCFVLLAYSCSFISYHRINFNINCCIIFATSPVIFYTVTEMFRLISHFFNFQFVMPALNLYMLCLYRTYFYSALFSTESSIVCIYVSQFTLQSNCIILTNTFFVSKNNEVDFVIYIYYIFFFSFNSSFDLAMHVCMNP